MNAESPPVKDLLELEIAKKVVLPRLRDIAREIPPRSKSHLYQVWCDKWGPLSRARFDAWLDMLEVTFIRVVVVSGLEEEDEPDNTATTNAIDRSIRNSFDEAIFDNEEEGEVDE